MNGKILMMTPIQKYNKIVNNWNVFLTIFKQLENKKLDYNSIKHQYYEEPNIDGTISECIKITDDNGYSVCWSLNIFNDIYQYFPL